MSASSGHRAVVMGAGISGLLAARVLADHVDDVVVVERDGLPETPRPRAGVPQGRHLHTLLPGGLEIACGYFAGLAEELEEAGAVRVRFGQDLAVYRPEGRSYLAPVYRPEPLVTGIDYFSMSRWLLEDVVRRRVRALPGVTVRGRSLVRGPLTSGDSVVGVVLDDGEVLDADLVVDAAGRAGRSVAWLAHLGFEPPPESVIECDVAYASAVLRPSAPEALTGAGVLVLPDPAGASPTRVGYLTPIEGGLWMAGLGGRFGDYPPAEVSGWRDFGRSLAWPGWDELVGTAELVGPPVPYRYPRSVRRHFERLERFPDGLLPLGDAICHVNPLYGQGMSAAAAQVRALDDVLDDRAHHRSGLDGLAREFFPLAFDATRTPWAVSAGADLVSPGTVGDYPDEELGGLLGLVQLGRLIDEDAEAAELLADIFSLRRPLSVLDQPGWRERLAPVAPASPVGVD